MASTTEEIKPLHLKLSAELVKRVDEYRYDNRIPSRTEAITILLEKSLAKVKSR